MLSFVAVLALFATGAGNSAPGFAAPLASRFLSSLRLGRTADAATATDVAPELAAASVAAAQATVGTVPTTDPLAVPAAPPTSVPSVDRPIVAPASFPRARAGRPGVALTAVIRGCP